MTLAPIVDTRSPVLTGLEAVWTHNFPTTDLVRAAAGMFTGTRLDDRALGVTLLPPADAPAVLTGASYAKGVELGFIAAPRLDHAMVEGPRWRVLISPGTVAVRSTDPARADRTHERQRRAQRAAVDALHDHPGPDLIGPMPATLMRPATSAGAETRRCVSAWSSKSRARMAETLHALDWSPMFVADDEVPGMLTLTYPGDWLAVAPTAEDARRHLMLFRKRYERAWGRRLVGVWKREFQRRGAPHVHLLMVPPHGQRNGRRFRDWAAQVWADVVGAEHCGQVDAVSDPDTGLIECCERHRHVAAGVGLDFAKGVRMRDPRSIGVYFAKHGAFAAKEYQNHAPAEWVEAGSVGRFWGYWGLQKAVAGVEVTPAEAIAVARTLRRLSRANSYETRVPVWRYRTLSADPQTGEVEVRWRLATKKARVYRVKGSAGFLVTKDGPALASALSRHLDRLMRPDQIVTRSGAGPIGFLP